MRDWKERTPGELYITGSDGTQTNQKGRRGLLLCSPKREMVLQPDGVRLDTGDTCNPGLRLCVEKHIQIILPFVSLAETPIKHRCREREREMGCYHPQRLHSCTQVCVCCCVSRKWDPVSAALHNVSQHTLIQIHHWELLPIISHTLWWFCLLQGYTVECHLKG